MTSEKKSNGFIWSDDEIEKFKKQIEWFKSFRHKPITQDNFFEAYKTCYLLCDQIPVSTTRVDVNYILRGRPNYNSQIFKEEWEISYNSRNKRIIKLGRFNRPGEPMFYGSVPDELDMQHFGLVAALECCKDLIDERNTIPYQYLTFGKWFLNSQFEVINLCCDDKFLSANPKLKRTTENHKKYIFETFPSKSADFIIEFWKFISDIAGYKAENDNDHFITTAFICAAINYRKNVFGQDIHGALFPSTMTENRGLNIVLTPTAVDNLLTLKSVFMVKFIRHAHNHKGFDIKQCSDESAVVNNCFKLGVKF